MEIREFWQVVDDIGWGSSRGARIPKGPHAGLMDVLGIQRILRADCTELQLEGFALLASTLVRDLREQPTDLHLPLSDFALDDLLSHVVGLGEAEYEACRQDPQRLIDRAASGEYEENFRYCFERPLEQPHPRD